MAKIHAVGELAGLTPDGSKAIIGAPVTNVRKSKFGTFIDVGIDGYDSTQVVVPDDGEHDFCPPKIGDVIEAKGITRETEASKRRGLDQTSLFVSPDDVEVVAESQMPRWPGADTRERNQAQGDYVRAVLQRSAMHSALRQYYESSGYVHVDTSILQRDASGATARTFDTEANFDGQERRLRIAPEVDLKVVMALSGLSKVFEIGRNFRNEGTSPHHHPEFTSLEAYTAFMGRSEAIDLTLSTLSIIATEVSTENPLGKEPPQRQYGDLLDEHLLGFSYETLLETDPSERTELLRRYLAEHNILNPELRDKEYIGIVDWLFKNGVRPELKQPLIVTGYMQEQLPLAAGDKIDERLADAFQIIIDGAEVVKAYSEEVNPEKLRENLAGQSGDREDTVALDTRLIEACRKGLPPMWGIGVGLDRVHKILGGYERIEDVIPVPINRR